MLSAPPQNVAEFMALGWPAIKAQFDDLEAHALSAANIDAWMREWSRLSDLLDETKERLQVATTIDTTDLEAEKHYNTFVEEIEPQAKTAQQRLKEKLLASGLEPANFAVPLRKMRTDAAIFREANLPLRVQEQQLALEYNKIVGAQTVEWEG